jgi:hypothetical protein
MRRSERIMRTAPLREVLNAIGFATRPRFVFEGDSHNRSLRPSLSAGALHPIEILLIDWRGGKQVMRYDALTHCIELLRISDHQSLSDFSRRCKEVLPHAHGTPLVFLARFPGVAAVYENPTSLVWRDAGALLQTLALAATAFRLAFCPMGILGRELVKAVGLDETDAQAVGGAIIGRSLGERVS